MVDFSSTDNAVVFEETVDIILQQIELLLDTRPGELLGEYDYGTNFDHYLYNPNIGNHAIEEEVRNYIGRNVYMFGWSFDVRVKFMVGTNNDILLLTISIYSDEEAYTKTYKVTEGAVDY